MTRPQAPNLAELRRSKIAALVRRNGSVTVSELVTEFGISPMTARRDINQLAQAKVLVRVHGGAVASPVESAPISSRRWKIGMIAPSFGNHWSKVVHAVEAEAARLGVQLEVRREETPREYLRVVRRTTVDARLDGLILGPPHAPDLRYAVDEWVQSHAPRTVYVERDASPHLAHVQSVVSDHARGAALAVHHLYGLGHRRLAVMLSPDGASWGDLLDGWHAAIAGLGLPVLPVLTRVRPSDDRRDELIRSMYAQLRDEAATAVFTLGDLSAMPLLNVARAAGSSVPEDLSIIGYGGQLAELGEDFLTAVRPPREAVGRAAVRLLFEHLRRGDNHAPQHVRLTPCLTIRESTGPARPVAG